MGRKKKQLKKGQVESALHIRCHQTQCAFYLQGGCKNCQDCEAEPYVLKKSCQRCNDCANVPNALRWDDDRLLEKPEMQREDLKEFQKMLEEAMKKKEVELIIR